MFIWDFTAIFAVWGVLLLSIVISMWVFYTLTRSQPLVGFTELENFEHCHYCDYIYLDYVKASVGRCPRCLSYLESKADLCA